MTKYNNEEAVTIGCYADQLVSNEDGINDKLESSYLIVSKKWAEEQALKQGYGTLEEFEDEYTYDNTDGWIELATMDGVLLGVGTGRIRDSEQQNELDNLTTLADELHGNMQEQGTDSLYTVEFVDKVITYLEKIGGKVKDMEYIKSK